MVVDGSSLVAASSAPAVASACKPASKNVRLGGSNGSSNGKAAITGSKKTHVANSQAPAASPRATGRTDSPRDRTKELRRAKTERAQDGMGRRALAEGQASGVAQGVGRAWRTSKMMQTFEL